MIVLLIYFLFCTAGIIPYFLLFVNSYFDIFFLIYSLPSTRVLPSELPFQSTSPYTVGDVLLTSAKRSSMSFQSTSPYTGDDICHIMSNKFNKQLSIVNFQKDKYFSFLYPPQEEYPHQEIYKDVQQ